MVAGTAGHGQRTGKEVVVFNNQKHLRPEKSSFLSKLLPNGRFRIEVNTVYDRRTDLTWQRHAHGLKWHGSQHTRTVFKHTMTFDQAVENDWGVDWRLPSVEELQSLLTDRQPDGYHIDTTAFPDVVQDRPLWYWSHTPDGPLLAWAVNFHHGHAYSGGRNIQNSVMLVKSGC